MTLYQVRLHAMTTEEFRGRKVRTTSEARERAAKASPEKLKAAREKLAERRRQYTGRDTL